MRYARVENEQITPNVGLPYTLEMPDGRVFCGFDVAIPEVQREHGFYELIDITPVFDSRLTYIGEPTYTVESERVTVEYALHDYSLTELKSKAIQTAYANCEAILNQYANGYSMAEIATFPIIQAEILNYVATSTIGAGMQAIINRGRHTADTLTAVLMPKITAQQTALLERDNHVAAIMAMTTCAEVVNYPVD